MPTRTVTRAKEAPDFVIDNETGAMLNTNNAGLKAYRERRALENKKLTEINDLKDRVQNIEDTLGRIENLLAQIWNKPPVAN